MNWLDKIILRKELTTMLDRILGHYKTTLAGVAAALFAVILNGRSTHSLAAALAAAAVGAIAKDK